MIFVKGKEEDKIYIYRIEIQNKLKQWRRMMMKIKEMPKGCKSCPYFVNNDDEGLILTCTKSGKAVWIDDVLFLGTARMSRCPLEIDDSTKTWFDRKWNKERKIRLLFQN